MAKTHDDFVDQGQDEQRWDIYEALTAGQVVRDAMKLAPSSGAPDPDSIDDLFESLGAVISGLPSAATIASAMAEKDVDSTGAETVTIVKALEVLLAVIGGKAVVSDLDTTHKQVEFLGRDGVSVILRVPVSIATAGERGDTEIDPS